MNVANNWDNIDNFGDGFAYFNVGGLAGSTGAVLSDLGVQAPGVGMAAGWMLNTGNAIIQKANLEEITEAGGLGAISGGVSGFVTQGGSALFNELMKIHWTSYENYTDLSAHNYHEITLGDYLFGSNSSDISNTIANQGIVNASVILNEIPDFLSQNANTNSTLQNRGGQIRSFTFVKDESTAMNMIWNSSFSNGKPLCETAMYKVMGGYLILPNINNTLTECRTYSSLIKGYEITINKASYFIEAVVHTHPNYNYGNIGISSQDNEMNRFRPTYILYNKYLYDIQGKEQYKVIK